ncbi:hypothetical protein ACIPRL_07830 [Streptomyces sp. NPDC090085]|uniref:hypothetical protein n=1 Tax=Streptomyces sp. NPDC090085 TaxID=3365943 RepID=UPI003822C477
MTINTAPHSAAVAFVSSLLSATRQPATDSSGTPLAELALEHAKLLVKDRGDAATTLAAVGLLAALAVTTPRPEGTVAEHHLAVLATSLLTDPA